MPRCGEKLWQSGLTVAAAAITKPTVAAAVNGILTKVAPACKPQVHADETLASVLKAGFFQADASMEQVCNAP